MVVVTCATSGANFDSIEVRGHSSYSEKGSDIVCAGISSIVEGAQSFFKLDYSEKVAVERNRLSTTFSILEPQNSSLQACLQMFVHQLKNVSHFYPKYIQVCSA